jgi:hypothetical protein
MRDGLGIALACNDLDWTRVWQVARRNCTVGRMVGVAAIGDAWLIEPPGGFWPKPGRSAVSGGNRVRVPAGRVITKQNKTYLWFKRYFYLEAYMGGPHWSADVVQSSLVLVFFIVVPKVPNGMLLSFVTQFLLLPALRCTELYSRGNLHALW